MRSFHPTSHHGIVALVFIAAILGCFLGGCTVDPNAPQTDTYSSSASGLSCWNGYCNLGMAYSQITVPRAPVASSGYSPQGQGFGGGFFPPSIEQKLGVAPNECFVDAPGGLRQTPCVLGRAIKGRFDALGGPALIYEPLSSN